MVLISAPAERCTQEKFFPYIKSLSFALEHAAKTLSLQFLNWHIHIVLTCNPAYKENHPLFASNQALNLPCLAERILF